LLANPLKSGADEQDRTADLLITNQLLYRLSYIGVPSIWVKPLKDRPIYRKRYLLSRFSFEWREVKKRESALTFKAALI
jgi:hypothetical protein